jgi:23S rRNA (uracil1939-C5)-methyltransferase
MSLQIHSEVVLQIEKPVAGGRMLARHEGQIVFVAGAIPGERVRARIDRLSKHLAFANTVDVLDPSPDRRPATVDWACGGSVYTHIGYGRQLRLKAEVIADAFARIAKAPLPSVVPVTGSNEEGYRMRARLHAADGRLGFFREGTHELCPPAPTRQLLPGTITALDRLMNALTISRDVLSCELSENIAGTERALLLELRSLERAPVELTPVEGITGVLFAEPNSAHINVAYGSPYVTDPLVFPTAPATLTHHVQSFFQGNRYLFPELAARVVAQCGQAPVIDLYAGVGLFAVSLAAHGRSDITAVEGDRSSARDLDTNAAAFGGAIRVEHSSVEVHLRTRRTSPPGTVVLDPPRTGVSADAMAGILALKAPHIVYVSCDPPTLARDFRRFVDAGYSLAHIEAFDLFPNTAHVETLAVLTR